MSNFYSKKALDSIPMFDGKSANLDAFISMVQMVHSKVHEQGKINLIRYVVAIKFYR